ncbi:hypothetical protein [Arenibacter nanhaiticus]|uniref:hypothetical protein n=1 Tax=Arenibacter nanhaiticus TaxID=558155 RepID=UPI0015B43DD1|nr:hypothetical protein [Arenibacter nanhaiticus]
MCTIFNIWHYGLILGTGRTEVAMSNFLFFDLSSLYIYGHYNTLPLVTATPPVGIKAQF